MTEIPEHLLNRSKARRAEASGEASGGTPAASSAPAKTESAAPAKASAAPAVKVEKPDPPYVKAAKERRKIPFWAMSGLALLPVWAFMYFVALTPPERVEAGPLSIGTEVYAGCAGCHGGDGAGGAGRALYQGEALKTFPQIEDMLNFVYTGSQKYVAAGLKVYGNPMPMQGEKAGGALTEAEILAVVCHIRYDLSGADKADEKWAAEYEHWCSSESEIFKGLEAGTTSFDTVDKDFATLMPAPVAVGTEPRESTAK